MTTQAYLFLLLAPFILGAAYQTQTAWLYLIGAADLGLLLTTWLIASLNLRGVGVSAMPPAPVHRGSPALLRLRLTRSARGEALSLQLLLLPQRLRKRFRYWRTALLPEGVSAVTVASVAPGAPVEVTLPLPSEKRGEFPLPPVYVQSAFPIGLVVRLRRFAPAGTYMVYPSAPRVEALPWLARGGQALGATRAIDVGHGTMLRGVREYRSGDAWRQIHWRTMARLGTPHVKETEQERSEVLTLFLDLRASVHSEATLEHMITVAAAIAAVAESLGRPLELVTQAEATPAGPWPSGPRQLAWLARAGATAPDGPVTGPAGALLLSPVAVSGWAEWASHFVHCPEAGAPAAPGAIAVPVGADIAERLGRVAA